ncbi:hypothetical protein D8674_017611 [Pyrus ussuriensis x Pyrus communis]|uniref:Uncharacterized protein n=1 Tax=Pyrus ussuriensis x Pyrus communis TaxID=2448454 RepID=A0A5N5HIC3_9ROSA|nr:hypothetical protein D8674_017611 [Pyrus ussuriensis x Pyrus communis]
MEDFRESNRITFLRVWVKSPQITMQFREVEIMNNITQPIGQCLRLDDAYINSFNAMTIRILIEVDVLLPLNYEQLFEVCIYYGGMTVEKCGCDLQELDVNLFIANKMFRDEPNVLPDGVKDDCLALADIKDDLIICLRQPPSRKGEGAWIS